METTLENVRIFANDTKTANSNSDTAEVLGQLLLPEVQLWAEKLVNIQTVTSTLLR